MVQVRKNEDDNFDILSGGDVVGEVSIVDETGISYVEVDESERGNGYGTRGLCEVVELLYEEYGVVRLSTPVDDSLRNVIYEYGFQEQYVMGDKLYTLY